MRMVVKRHGSSLSFFQIIAMATCERSTGTAQLYSLHCHEETASELTRPQTVRRSGNKLHKTCVWYPAGVFRDTQHERLQNTNQTLPRCNHPSTTRIIHSSCSMCGPHQRHGHVSGHVVLGGLPVALNEWRQRLGQLIDAMDRSVEELGPEPPAWWGRGQPMQLTMAAVAEHVAVQDIASVAAEPTGDEPATAGDGAGEGAGDDKPAEPCTKRRKGEEAVLLFFPRQARLDHGAVSPLRKKGTPILLRARAHGHTPQVYSSQPPAVLAWQTSCPASAAECAVAQESWQNS